MSSKETPKTNGRLTPEEAQGVDRYMQKFFTATAMAAVENSHNDSEIEPLEDDR